MRRRLLPTLVLLALALALAGALAAPAPARLPAIALGALLVWRMEVASVTFTALYGVIVVLRLALHGETLTRVGRDGIEFPRVGSAHAEERVRRAAMRAEELRRLVVTADRHDESEDPIHPLLRPEEEDA